MQSCDTELRLSDSPGSPLRAVLAVVSLTLGSFGYVTSEFLPVGVLPQIAETFGTSIGTTGLLVTLPGLCAAFAALGVLVGAGKVDRRSIVMLLSLLLLVSSLICALAPNFAVMLVGRVLMGIGMGAFWAMSLSVAGRLVSASQSHFAVAAVFAGVTTAMIFGVPIGTFITEMSSWREAFMLAGGLGVLSLLLQLKFLPSLPPETESSLSGLMQFARAVAVKKSMVLILVVFAANFLTYTYIAPYLAHAGINSDSATFVFLIYGVMGFIANLISAPLVGRRLKEVLFVSLVLMCVGILLLPLSAASPILAVGAVILWGLAWGAIPLCLNLWIRGVAEGNEEAASSVFTFTVQLAIAIGSFGGGVVVDKIGLVADFVVGTVLVALSAIYVLTQKTFSR